MEIIVPLITFISGIMLAYIGYKYQVSRDKLSTKRERLLSNISKVERFLSLVLELETIQIQLEEIKRTRQEILKELERLIKEKTEIQERHKESRVKSAKIKKKLLQAKKKDTAQDENEMESMKDQLNGEEKRIREEEIEFNKKLINLDDVSQMVNAQGVRLEEMKKEISMSDIDVVCKMIDPSNKLGRYVGEMSENHLKLFHDRENASYIRKSIDLRYEILKLLDSKIK